MSRPAGTAATPLRRVWTPPNVLSFLRLASVPVFIWLFVSGREEAAVILYMVGAWSDFFDGYLARRMGWISELGKLLDPLADRIFIVALALALVASGALWLWLAVVLIARDVLLLAAWAVLERRGRPRIAVNFTGKCATACLLFGLSALAWSETSWPLQQVADEIGLSFTIAGAVLYWVAAALYVRSLKVDLSTDRLIDGKESDERGS